MNSFKKFKIPNGVKLIWLIGKANIVVMLTGLLKVKIAAILIGSNGIGLITVITSLTGVILSISNFGIDRGSVRVYARATEGKTEFNQIDIKNTINLIYTFTGLLVASILFFSSIYLGRFLDIHDYSSHLFLIGIVVFMNLLVSNLQSFMQGNQRTDLITVSQITLSISSVFIAFFCYYFYSISGVFLAITLTSIIQFLIFYKNSKKINCLETQWQISTFSTIIKASYGLSASMYITGLLSNGVNFLIVALIKSTGDLSSVGVFSASIMISSIVVNIFLQAITFDLYPKIAKMDGNDDIIDAVNERIVAYTCINVIPLLILIQNDHYFIELIYNKEFLEATGIVPILSLAYFIQLASWPIRMILLARDRGRTYLFTETCLSFGLFSLAYLCIDTWGVSKIGYAFLIAHLLYLALLLVVAGKTCDFRLSPRSVKVIYKIIFLLCCYFMAKSLENMLSIGLLIFAFLLIIGDVITEIKKILHIQ